MSEQVVAILLAAGASARMAGVDKLWADLCGLPVAGRSLRAIAAVEGIASLVAVAPRERHAELGALAQRAGVAIACVEGGVRRQDSVAAGIAAAPEATWYLVHDAARPLASPALAARVLEAARAHGAAVPVTPVVDTIKRVDLDGLVRDTLDRSALRAVQTPQAFAGDVLRRAHAEVRDDATDDAAMVERLGLPVATVEGDPANIKITRPADLVLARALLAELGGR